MDKLYESAKGFEKLLNTKYYIKLGRKNKLCEIELIFSKWDFHHLMGLGKLTDLKISKNNRTKVFEDIINGKIKYEDISKSETIYAIADRFQPLSNIESILDCNEVVFRYNKKEKVFSSIEADFLMSTYFKNNEIYIFLGKNNEEKCFCKSFFPKTGKDYTERQAKFTLIYKEKINLKTNEKKSSI